MSGEQLSGPYRERLKHPPPAGDRTARHAIELELQEGERILWAGQPPQGVRFSLFDIFMIPFSLVWGGFAIFWEATVIVVGAPFFFALFGVPFVVVGLYLMVGRFFIDARERARTFYGVTDRRALIVTNTPTRRVQEVYLERQKPVTLMERKNGSGTILFGGSPVTAGPDGSFTPTKSTTGPPTFEKIQDARSVYQMIQDAQADLRERRRTAEDPLRVAPALSKEKEEEFEGVDVDESTADRSYRA
ncbi:MAG: hypothetical protein L6Q76_12045 [Polyangiaceae bacterium]|nr:hypothetical protein [Polyangiaceae bacterium]